ncbi:hypothetical protein H6P81_018972 [Aristolochia fimbriata]|uniref:F-box domain-containing protein n=1 Tax=Aristolochia fimbriata TaxID=158543 RepID=A0AAV7E6Y4_ARIFI|nr:hypothetical protein H6P81_018972 [Aristolochia fimbriata]
MEIELMDPSSAKQDVPNWFLPLRDEEKMRGPTEICDLNNDVMTEILLRLPLRPLITSKCVSKHWYGLLSGVSIKPQLAHTTGVFSYDDGDEWGYLRHVPEADDEYAQDVHSAVDTALSFLPTFPDVLVVAGSHGLLLATAGTQKRGGSFFVCNPLTKKYREVPRPRTARGHRMRMHSVGLDFNPKTSPFFKIIFYRHSHDRLFRKRTANRPLELELEIYSSEVGKWVNSEATEWASASCTYTHMVSLNGVIYRVDRKQQQEEEEEEEQQAKQKIVEVDELRVPVATATSSYGSIGQAAGSIYYAYGDKEKSTVWVLREEKGKASWWELKHHVTMSKFTGLAERDLGAGDWKNIVYQPMVFLSSHELAFLEDSGGGVIYDCDKARFKRMEIVRQHGITSARFKAFPFTPCLYDPSLASAVPAAAGASTSG